MVIDVAIIGIDRYGFGEVLHSFVRVLHLHVHAAALDQRIGS